MTATTSLRRAKPHSIGGAGVVEAAREYVVDVGTVAGLWPFSLRTNPSQHGTPLGVDPNSGQLAGYDPHTSFLDGRQRAAQLAILAANGTGKSVLAKKLATGFAGQGIPTIVPFDAKNEYTPLIDALGGTTLTVDRSGGLNALDPGEAIAHAIATGAPTRVLAELRARRNQLVATIAGISRGAALTGWEQTALTAVLNHLRPGAVLADLAEAFRTNPDLLATVIGRDPERADELLEPLTLDIAALAQGNIGQALGTAGPDQHWSVERPLVIDTSAVLATEPELTAAVTVTCWTAALSAIHHANATGAERVFAVIFDEIWRATREFPALANQIGGLLRMDRNDGIITILATHSWTDTANPGGSNILARCAAFAIGGLQNEEIDTIATAGIGLNAAELDEIRANSTAGTAAGVAHGGTGRFLIKTGDRPGQLVQTILTPTEQALYDTNHKWTTTNTTPRPHHHDRSPETASHDGDEPPADATDHHDGNDAEDQLLIEDLAHLDEDLDVVLERSDVAGGDVQASSWPDGAPITRAEQLVAPAEIDLSGYAYQRADPLPARPVEVAVLARLDIDDPPETVTTCGAGWSEDLDQSNADTGKPSPALKTSEDGLDGDTDTVSWQPSTQRRPESGQGLVGCAEALATEATGVVATLEPETTGAGLDEADRAWDHWQQVSTQLDDDNDPEAAQVHPLVGPTRALFRACVVIYVFAAVLYAGWAIAALVAAALIAFLVPAVERWITTTMNPTQPRTPEV